MKVQMVVTHIPTDREATHDEDAPLAYRRPLETRTRVRAENIPEARLSTLNVLLGVPTKKEGGMARFPAASASA